MKKFPSLIRLPKSREFSFEPRYYDPIKEDIENRIAQAKAELKNDPTTTYRSNISGAFRANLKTGETKTTAPALIQLIIFVLLLGGFTAWLFTDSWLPYVRQYLYHILIVICLIYLVFRLRKFF
ncbi:MAG: hypothetical protein RJQ09_07100 [Cyclobacteriaceae bacterium]